MFALYVVVCGCFVAAAIVAIALIISDRYTTTRPPAQGRPVTPPPRGIGDPARPVPASRVHFKRYSVDRGPSLSIVVPCYNEEHRLPSMLRDTVNFCEATVLRPLAGDDPRAGGLFSDYELVLVDDCSTDGTARVVQQFSAEHPNVLMSLVPLPVNRGKGHAVRTGFFHARGDYVLMADADGASNIADVSKLFRALRRPLQCGKPAPGTAPGVAVGSRAHLEQKSIAQRSLLRTVLMKAFHLVVNVTYLVATRRVCPVQDTQCGFKLFSRRHCELLFLSNRLERWAFDVELLITAQRVGLTVVEVPVEWAEIPGSKVNLWGMAQMGVECVIMCIVFPLGLWPIVRS